MLPIKIKATVDGALYEVEFRQIDPLHPDFEVIQDGKIIAKLHKENSRWSTNDEACLRPVEISAIGKAIDEKLQEY